LVCIEAIEENIDTVLIPLLLEFKTQAFFCPVSTACMRAGCFVRFESSLGGATLLHRSVLRGRVVLAQEIFTQASHLIHHRKRSGAIHADEMADGMDCFITTHLAMTT